MYKYVCGKFMQKNVEFIKEFDGVKVNTIKYLKDGKAVIGTDNGFYYTKSDGTYGNFKCDSVKCICEGKDGSVFFSSGKTLYKKKGTKITEFQKFDENIEGIDGDDIIYLITSSVIYKLEDKEFCQYFGNEMPSEGLSVCNGKIRSFSGRCLTVFAGKRKNWRCIYPEHTDMPEFKIYTVKIDPSTGFVWLGTDKGLCIYDDGACWYTSEKISFLPQEDIYDIAFGKQGEAVLASSAGVIIIKNGAKKYLQATRYVPVSKVNCVTVKDGEIFAGTDCGISRIYEKETTLEEKADYYYELCEKLYVRKDGYVTGLGGIVNGDMSTGYPRITDNDGLWTQMYIASLCLNYAVTGNKKVLASARRSMMAMVKLAKITGIKGFTARAIRYPDEEGYGKKLDLPIDGGEWHRAPDGVTEWLGETSSDEMTGHFFGFSLYYDLCANEKEKKIIREVICDIVDHIISNNYRLCDIDGLPTTWACWTPSELNGNCMWQWEKCVNSLEILAFLNVAYHMSGDEKYRKEFMRLAIDEHYLLNAAQHKKDDGRVTHIDDNLAFLCTVTMLRYEKDEGIRSYIKMGMKHHWDYERTEHFAFWNLVYGAFTGEVCDIDIAVKYLKDMPLNLTDFKNFNTCRKDLEFDTEQEKWGGEPQLRIPLDVDERSFRSYSDNPYLVDRGRPSVAVPPENYLLPYWFGRYFGIIE